ncbi:DNA helicase [Actinocorallia libanotica]|uniref:Helicase-related protein n=1 Tax=Actinocorallia libanotica TaxID=46162 RepID=A0ABN1RAG3_9ACTN
MSRHGEHYRFRSELVERLKNDLLGPVNGPDEIITDRPGTAYATGVLFPRRSDQEHLLAQKAEVEKDVDEASLTVDEAPDSGVPAANMQAPSSMGITFAVDPKRSGTVVLSFEAAVYEPIDRDGRNVQAKRSESRATHDTDLRWRRRPLTIPSRVIDVAQVGRERPQLVDGLAADINVRRPDLKTGFVAVTVALMNINEVGRYDIHDAHCFFQPVIEVMSPDDTVALVERPSTSVGVDEDEIKTNRLLYRHAPTFAVGHGCSADWNWQAPPPRHEDLLKSEPASVASVRTAFVPTREVLLTDSNPEIDASDLAMMHLAKADDDEVLAALRRLTDGYREWITERSEEARLLRNTDFGKAAEDQINQCVEACDRMESGIELLRSDIKAMRAFRLANEAMAVQRGRSQWIKNGRVGEVRLDGVWRPFQIAFLLMCMDGIVDPDHDDRKLADLLWFPTGGGKTEAYLGIIAFTVFLRRIRKGKAGGGVTSIMRYTLRLLTLQQFERAASLICAMEMMRRDAGDELGDEEMPISLGMWVGRAATPNTLKDAAKSLRRLRNGEELQEENPVQLRTCPWCGTAMDAWNYEVSAETGRMEIRCSNDGCDFRDGLPVHVVDEAIYAARPTLVIATADKFAQIAWRAAVANLFNRNEDGRGTPPPELIVQDELHLISGPLGSLAGLYETAIDIAADQPKIIASTATIRRAKDQVLRLFDRDVRQFPPAGLDARDSWFAVETPAEDKASRQYVGLLTPNTSQATLLVRAYAALLHHAAHIDADDTTRDAYWTLVGYFSSLRLLAAAELQFHDDVQDRLHLLAEQWGTDRRAAEMLAELTSRVQSSDIPQRLKDLETRLPSPDALDTVLATNMISVGVDVDRLGLMALMGQPQTTAEYIQSSSRVGRQHPGLAIMMFNAARSRDRSHYESFVSYHSALYQQVESTSVTPFSSRARDRALHAVLVGLMRLTRPEARLNTAAAKVRKFEHRLEEAKDLILIRAKSVAPEEADGTAEDLQSLIDYWYAMADQNEDLVYEAPSIFKRGDRRGENVALLRSYEDEDLDNAIRTLWSLRDVDVESDLYKES